MKKYFALMAIIIGLFLSACIPAPAMSVAVDKDVGFSYVLPADHSPDMVFIENPVLFQLNDLVACSENIGVEKPINMNIEGSMLIASEVSYRQIPITSLWFGHIIAREASNVPTATGTTNSHGDRRCRLDIGEILNC